MMGHWATDPLEMKLVGRLFLRFEQFLEVNAATAGVEW
jgi:hypothetical protein